jgi:hypothetical protein
LKAVDNLLAATFGFLYLCSEHALFSLLLSCGLAKSWHFISKLNGAIGGDGFHAILGLFLLFSALGEFPEERGDFKFFLLEIVFPILGINLEGIKKIFNFQVLIQADSLWIECEFDGCSGETLSKFN